MNDKVNILMVDDMDDNLVALEAVLAGLRQNLVRARSGEEALKAVLRQEFAVILLDVVMDGMDGFDTAAHIKRLDQTRAVPIIFLTGTDGSSGPPLRGYSAGAVDYLTKPFDPWVLRAKVSVFVELHLKNRRLVEQTRLLRELLGEGDEGRARLLETVMARLDRVEREMRELRGGAPPGGGGEDGRGAGLDALAAEVAGLGEAVRGLSARG